MMHFFRRATINLDVFTHNATIMEATPINYGMKYIPEWWKKLPNEQPTPYKTDVSNMRGCVGMYNLYVKSVVMPLWTDMLIETASGSNHMAYKVADSNTQVIRHPKSQCEGFLASNSQHHLKILSPWFFRAKEDVNWFMSNPIYNMANISDYYVLPGLVNYSRQQATNIQMAFSSEVNRKLVLPAGLPIAMFTPMTEKKVKLHRHLVDINTIGTLGSKSTLTSFTSSYIKIQQNIKNNNCPFTDHTGVIK